MRRAACRERGLRAARPPDGSAEDWLAARDLRRLMVQLPERQRLAIELVRLAGVSVRDAARQLGLSEANVKVIVHRG